MPYIRVVTDSACDIPDALLRQFDVTVVPFSIGWGEERYLDGVNITTPQLLRLLEEHGGPLPEARAPSIDDFSRVYRAMRETCDGVLSLHVSAKLSDAQANANIAREAFGPVGHGGPFPIAVVDSMTMSMGLGWMVLAVARAAMAGLDLVKLVNLAGRLRGQTHVAFITEDMSGLSRLMPQLSAISSLRPLFHIEEGQIEVYERTRTRAKARDALYNFVEDFPKIGEMAVITTSSPNDLDHLLTRVGAVYPRERPIIIQPGPAVASWLGLEALGV